MEMAKNSHAQYEAYLAAQRETERQNETQKRKREEEIITKTTQATKLQITEAQIRLTAAQNLIISGNEKLKSSISLPGVKR